jgi:single-strand DNA-binding protein
MSYEITGKILKIFPTETFASGFQKRAFVVETDDEKYPQQIKMEAVKDKCDVLDSYDEGDEITAEFNLRGNEYNGKYYVSLQAWKFDKAASEPRRPVQKSMPPAPVDNSATDADTDDQIPFSPIPNVLIF